LPNFGEDILYMKRDFLKYYKSYIKTCLSYWLICFAGYCAQFFEADIAPYGDSTLVGILDDCAKVTSTAKLMIPCLFFLVRIQDPLIRKRIWKPFQKMQLFSASQSAASKEEECIQSPVKNKLNTQKSFEDIRNSIASEEDEALEFGVVEAEKRLEVRDLDSDADDLMWMNLLPAKIKESYTRTFLACIYCKYEEKLLQKAGFVCTGLKDSQDICYYTIKGSNLMRSLKAKNSIIDCKFTIYYPILFKEIIDSSYRKISIKESLDIFKNEDRIRKAGESGGGASGELFMFSHNNRFVLKTATHQEIKVFNQIMVDYKEHFKRCPDSQISRIYGLFDFTFRESDKSIKLILIENICPLNSEFILRKYDLKGSKHARKVMKSHKEFTKDSRIDKVLKDLDFLETETEIHIEHNVRTALFSAIQADVEFFSRHGIIDYSVILAVVDKRGVESLEQFGELKIKNPHILRSATDPDRLYFIGIIDYFQLYDFKKALERFFKRLSKCNPGLDTSSQPPKIYSARFSTFIEKIIK
jgi:Phosphatidylinositol-4-phosphate 5-Kinase